MKQSKKDRLAFERVAMELIKGGDDNLVRNLENLTVRQIDQLIGISPRTVRYLNKANRFTRLRAVRLDSRAIGYGEATQEEIKEILRLRYGAAVYFGPLSEALQVTALKSNGGSTIGMHLSNPAETIQIYVASKVREGFEFFREPTKRAVGIYEGTIKRNINTSNFISLLRLVLRDNVDYILFANELKVAMLHSGSNYVKEYPLIFQVLNLIERELDKQDQDLVIQE